MIRDYSRLFVAEHVYSFSMAQEMMNSLNKGKSKAKAWWKPVVLMGALVLVVMLARIFGIGDRLGDLRGWIRGLGAWGPAVFVLLYIAAVVAAIPGSAITVAAGALFGSAAGIILVSLGSTIGAGLCFLIARFFARDAAAKWLSSNEKFRKLDQMTEQHGAIIVALTRLVPLFPFNLLNYGFGLTKIPFKTYLFWSWLCMLPATVLFVIGTDAIVKGVSEGKIPWGLIALAAGAAVLLGFLVQSARKRLQEKKSGENRK
ncbi:MAG: hypothetical protein COT35_13375 [Nitrospirae bacterium CG08_land_8_20_14_0_20_52_24]|nr:MAG: hypothetical protein COT35_13375 [Nitrospirae bacterium CG08_land_8_20_14_0_20_52_24]